MTPRLFIRLRCAVLPSLCRPLQPSSMCQLPRKRCSHSLCKRVPASVCRSICGSAAPSSQLFEPFSDISRRSRRDLVEITTRCPLRRSLRSPLHPSLPSSPRCYRGLAIPACRSWVDLSSGARTSADEDYPCVDICRHSVTFPVVVTAITILSSAEDGSPLYSSHRTLRYTYRPHLRSLSTIP